MKTAILQSGKRLLSSLAMPKGDGLGFVSKDIQSSKAVRCLWEDYADLFRELRGDLANKVLFNTPCIRCCRTSDPSIDISLYDMNL